MTLDESSFDLTDAIVVKDGNLFMVARRDGVLPAEGPHPYGLYYNDCRFLSTWELDVGGVRLRPLVGSAEDNVRAAHELADETRALQVRVERSLADGVRLDERITLRSFRAEPVALDVTLRLAGGFEPMMWIRGIATDFGPERPQVVETEHGVTLELRGRDGVLRRLVTTASPAAAIDGGELRWRLQLERGRTQTIALRHEVGEDEPGRAPRRLAASQQPATTSVHTDDELFNRILERSFADLAMLRSQLGGETYFAAGIPWYATLFGRDTLITSLQMVAYDRDVAEQTLRLFARNLGTSVDAARDEEPGKVLHELRVGELANLGVLPFARYYGSVDSTPLFLCLLAEHAQWSGDLSLVRELAAEIDAALGWIDNWGDRDVDGLLEYERGAATGLQNQGWKDSPDGVPDEHGRPLETPIALVEPQGYVVRAKEGLARLFELAGEAQRAECLRAEGAALRERLERFWLEREGFYSLGLDGSKRASAALASNQGHLLWARAVGAERAGAIRAALMRSEMFCGWGVRTLASSEPGYNPIGYHTGSVWPHDSALIAAGLRNYGHDDDFARIFEGLLEAASRFPEYRLPELFAGFARSEYEIPVPYPVACRPQAWAAATIPYLLWTGLGLVPDALGRTLRVVRPLLPDWLSRVEVNGLRVADASIDLTFTRAGDTVTVADAKVDGDVEVTLEPAGSDASRFVS